MTWFALAGVALAWGYSVFRNAGTETASWAVALAAVGLAAAVYFPLSRAPARLPVRLALLFGLLIFTAFQIVPLPIGMVRLLSPVRAGIAQAMAPVLGSPAAVSFSTSLNLTVERFAQMLGCILVLLLVRDLYGRLGSRRWAVVVPLLVVAGLEAALGVVQHIWEGPDAVASGTYANRNHFAGLLEMCLPFAVMAAVAVARHPRSRGSSPAGPAILACGLFALAALMLLGIVFSLSRMGFLAALSGLLVTGILSLSPARPGWRQWVPGAGVAAAVLLGFLLLPTESLISRLAALAHTDEISADTRTLIWKDTMKIVRDYPLVGCGLGAFEPTMVRYQSVAPMNAINFAHNDYLQFLAELGLPAALALAWLLISVFAGALRTAASTRGSGRYLALACAGAFTALLLHSLVDFNFYVPANAMLAAWIAGIAEGVREFR